MFQKRAISELRQGVNVFGYAFAEHGVGQLMRRVAQVVLEAQLPYSILPYPETYSRQRASFADFGAGETVFDINIICVNADTIPQFVARVGPELLEGRYNIGVWAWEVEDLPAAMASSSRYLDEIWGISRYTADAIAKAVACPVLRFPCPVPVPDVIGAPRPRSELGLSEDFLFFFALDFNSIMERKNPLGLISAFKRAFSPEDPVQLVIKTINGDSFPSKVLRLNSAAIGHPGIRVVDGYLPAGEQEALMNSCDAYVSLHRSEGFGFTLAEAMSMGKPVIGTAYSGTLDFMDDANSFLVPYERVEVGEGSAPYPSASRWAEPDLDEAACLMRWVFEHPEEAQQRARRAREDIRRRHTPAARAEFVAARLHTIREEAAATWSGPGPFEVIGLDREALRSEGSEADRLSAMEASEFMRTHRGFADVGQLFAARLVEFDEDKVDRNLVCGALEGVRPEADGTTSLWGWVHDPRDNSPARAVALVVHGKWVPVEIQVGVFRQDRADVDAELAQCGWHFAAPGDLKAEEPSSIEAYAVLRDGVVGCLPWTGTDDSATEELSVASPSAAEMVDYVAARRSELLRLIDQRAAMQRTFDQLLASRSWRLTRPLRKLYGLFRIQKPS